ncbi:putative Ig domain-containing protein [Opitutus terrae]|uniref:Conserved repeat domain protein n=1 Tax=Opitutus terrae (strain DSM 11246 / JCM 15787 / PB90-1) TaxID=452637 RepID=B1ZQC2_OPITP|nr:putative Ig domain-containing protein [Opitutus terrae]ACB73602.1 conserved repeat domain protein [Opitutus terrae PB90-1]
MKNTVCRLALALIGTTLFAPYVGSAASVTGGATAELLDWTALDGKVYDVVRLTGPTATVSADAGQHVRVRFLDKHGDLVNVDFSGAGTLTIALDPATASSAPIPAALYNLPSVEFMQGDAALTIVNANETSNLTVFPSGRGTEVDRSFLRSDITYEGWADITRVTIVGRAPFPSKFGFLNTAYVRYGATSGITGISAGDVELWGSVPISDVEASGTATPCLMFGTTMTVRIFGGDLAQPNGKPILLRGTSPAILHFNEGFDSNDVMLPTQPNRGTFTGQPPSFWTHPSSAIVVEDRSGVFAVNAGNTTTYQWARNGVSLVGATSQTLTVSHAQPASTGVYQVLATNWCSADSSLPAILGITTTSKVLGAGQELEPHNLVHPAGYTFDQVLVTGAALSVTSDFNVTSNSWEVTRLLFIDLDDDLVAVEFRGPGTLSVVLDDAVGPAAPLKYNQPSVQYIKGHAGLIIAGADERTHLSITSVGRATTFDPTGTFDITAPITAINDPANNGSPLFTGQEATAYDGIADIAYIAVLSNNGKFGGIDAANANCFASRGLAGIFAPGVVFTGPVLLGNVTAFDSATPVLVFGTTADLDLRIVGGNLAQPNGRNLYASGFGSPSDIQFVAGADSHGRAIAANTNEAVFEPYPVTGQSPGIISAASATFVVGQRGTFAVEGTGTPAPTISVQGLPTWASLSNDGVISGIPPIAGPSTLTVTAANGVGAPISQTFILQVLDPLVVEPPRAGTVWAGSSITLYASASGGGDLTYQWRHEGQPISGATSSSYTIPSATMSDAGLYDVVVSRFDRQLVSGAAVLSVAPASYAFPGIMRVDPSFHPMIEKLGGQIYALAQQPDGQLIIGGEFSRLNGVVRPNIARTDGTGAVDLTFDPGKGPNDSVRRIVRQPDGKILVAGDFTSYGGFPRYHVARINADGTLDHSFDPGAGPNGEVVALALEPNGKIILGGSFLSCDGLSRPRVVRLNSNGAVDTTFNPGSGANNPVSAVALQPDGKIVIAGSFIQYNGVLRPRVARLHPDGSLDTSFVFPADGLLLPTSLALQPDGKVLVGTFSGPKLLRLNADGSVDDSFSVAPTNPVLTLALQPDGKIVVGAGYDPGSGLPTQYITRFNPTGTVDSGFSPGNTLPIHVRALALAADGSVTIGGTDAFAGSSEARVLRLTADGTADPSLAVALRSLATIQRMQRQRDGKLIIVGDFQYVDNVEQSGIARLNANGSRDESFSAGSGADDKIAELLLQPDGKILVAGRFSHIAGVARQRIGRLLSDGSLDLSFDPGTGPDGEIKAMGLQLDGRILIAGGFVSYRGERRLYVARAEPDGSLDSTFQTNGTGPGGLIEHLVLQRDGKIVLGGTFTTYNGTPQAKLVRLNPDGSLDMSFSSGLPTDRTLLGIWALPNEELLVSLEGSESLVRLRSSGMLDSDFVTGNLAPVLVQAGSVLVQADDYVLVGRSLDIATPADPAPPGLVRVRRNGTVDPGFAIPGLRDAQVSQILMLDDGQLLLAGTHFSDGYVHQGGVARLMGAFHPWFTSPDERTFTVGTQNVATVTAGGVPAPRYDVTDGQFPSWASLSPITGVISGTPFSSAGSPFTFTIKASNGVGTDAFQTFTLRVAEGSISIAPLQSETATAGETITWSASVTGETPASYQWRVNGQPIAGATSASYTIPAVTMHDAGHYEVVVTSAVGQSFISVAGNLDVAPTRYPGAMQLDPTFAPLIEAAGGTILSIARQPDGKLVAGGSFSRINGVLRRNLARLNADGSVDLTFDPGLGPDQPVYKVLVQPDGKILLGGEFVHYDGVTRGRIARVNSDGSLDHAFADGIGAGGRIEAIALQPDGKIVTGGWFQTFGGLSRSRCVRLNPDGTVDSSFDVGDGAGVKDLKLLSDGHILLAGPFTSYNGQPRAGLVRLKADGSVDPEFVPDTWSGLDATSLAIQPDGKLIVGASSFEQNGPDLLRLNQDGSRDTGFTPPPFRNIDALELRADGKILIGGSFRSAGTVRYQVAQLQSNGALDSNFGSSGSLDFDVETIALLPSGEIVVAGASLMREGSTHNALARLKASGSMDTSFAGEVRSPGTVEALLRQRDGKLVLGGWFSHVDGASRKGIVRLSADGALDVDFAPAVTLVGGATGASARVSALVSQPDGKIVFAGFFDRVNGLVRNRIARLLPNGSIDPTFDPGFGASSWIATAALQPDGKILLGGLFSAYAGVTRNTLARINPNGSLDPTFDPKQGANWSVSQLVLQPDGRALVCGGFTSFAGVSRKGVVRVNTDGSLDTSFGATNGLASTAESVLLDPSGLAYVGRWDGVTRLTASGSIDATYSNADLSDVGNIGVIYRQADGRLIVGQDINSGSDGPTIGIARVNASGTRDASFTVLGLAEAHLSAIEVLEDGRMLIAGTTFNDGTMEQFGLARLMFVPAPSITQPPANATINVGQTGTFSVVAAGEGPFTYQWRKAGNPITGNASATTATLTITNVQLADAGDYDVVVTNMGGTTTSSLATFVVYLPPQITSQPANRTITAGGSASFSVVATGSPTPTYQWRRNGAALPGATAASLTLADIPANGGGAITVVVTNAGGFLESDPATLTVNPIAPEFATGLPATATAIQGRGFYFPVVTNTTPAVFTAPGLEAAGGTLTINSSSGAISGVPANLGSFAVTIIATNSTGSDTHVLDLVVQPPPPVITSAAAASGRTDTAFNFAVVATNTPSTYSATGLPDGLVIEAGTGEIHGTATVAGTYTVVLTVTNASGAITQPFILTIAPPPNTPAYTGTLSPAGVQGVAFSFTPAFGTVTAPYALIGSLPAGLSFAPATGVISGTPDAMGSFPVKLSATNAAGTTTVDLTIVINPAPNAPVITSASVAPVTRVGDTFSFTLTSSGTPLASSYNAAPLPAGLTLDPSTGVISGAPAAFGTYYVDVAATNSIGIGPEAVLVITIVPSVGAPVVNSAPITLGHVGVPFTYTLAASNDPASFSITTGTLPDGLQLDTTNGTITGTPEATAVGESRVWFNATNGSGVGIPSEVLFRIAPALTTPVIISNGTAIAQVGQPFQYAIASRSDSAVTGYEAAGLPAWLTLNATTGVLAGIPSEPTSAPISASLSATNANGTGSTKVLQLTIIPAPGTPRITSSLTALGRVGTAFSYQISASDSPTSFLATGLPTGLALDPLSGLITGTPASADTFEVILRAANANGLGNAATLKLGLAPALNAPAITSAATATGQVGAAFTYQITASNGPILSYAVSGALPQGLTFNSATGEITGKPADDPRIYPVNLTASTTAGTSSPQPLLIAIAPAIGVPVLTTSEYVTARVGEPFSYTITASNLSGTAPYAPPILLDAVNLPAGLAVNPATGTIQGSPTEAGTSIATLTATNAAGTSAARDLTFTIRPAAAAPLFEPAGEVAAQVGQAFSYQIIAGNAPDSYETLDAPGWMHVNATTGFITGVPEAPGMWVIRLVAANAAGSSSPVPLRVIVAPAANTPLVTSSRTHVGTVGTAMSFTIEAAPTMPAVTFAATGLPPGLTLNTATGVVNGTPVESGTFEVIVTPTSSNGTGAPVTFTITIRPNVTFGS